MFSDRGIYMWWRQAHMEKTSRRKPSTVSWTMPRLTCSVLPHCFLPTSSAALWNHWLIKSERMCLSLMTICLTVPVKKRETACQSLWLLFHEIQIRIPDAPLGMGGRELLYSSQLQSVFRNGGQEPALWSRTLRRPFSCREKAPPVTAQSHEWHGGTDPFHTMHRHLSRICVVW